MPTIGPLWQRARLLVSTWSQFVSSSEQKSFATTAACAAAFPFMVSDLLAGFSELARLNLSMYAAVLALAHNRRESMLPPQKQESLALNLTGRLAPVVSPFAAHTGAVVDMTLQTSVALNCFALDGYVETARHASAAIAVMLRSLRVADSMMNSTSPVSVDSDCAVTAMPVAAVRDIARKDANAIASVVPIGRRRRSPSS
ncbi:MAG TPA: hypothetical protein VJU59_33555 [Paraburkholderia sp.]|uniref:hypothetical protein n=1 Tax=Paraburkholderia sp. TaxID=1926495 RepID=UPI002B46F16D|nr:hypothetical protein [Paraburkholderia sp.]HKR44545.1 hypothetical protein [Paraburkholderia sp.]